MNQRINPRTHGAVRASPNNNRYVGRRGKGVCWNIDRRRIPPLESLSRFD